MLFHEIKIGNYPTILNLRVRSAIRILTFFPDTSISLARGIDTGADRIHNLNFLNARDQGKFYSSIASSRF